MIEKHRGILAQEERDCDDQKTVSPDVCYADVFGDDDDAVPDDYSIVVGSLLGVDAMSAYGFSSPLLTIYVALGSLMINGVQVRLGQAKGRADRDASNDCYSTSIIMSLVLAAMCILLVFAAGNPLCALLGAGEANAENAVFHLTKDYLRGYMLGAPFFFLS